MMKASELQINDFVQCGNRVEKVLELVNTHPASSNPYKISTRFVGGFFHRKEEEVAPIPLTAEILEKNGFTKVNSQRHELNDGDRYINVNPKRGYIYVNGKKNHCNVYDNFTVHGFQHALRVCGLSILANNLEV